MAKEQIEPGDFVQSQCKKCKKGTKHIVVGLLDGTPTKVQCTVCKGNHAYKGESSAAKPPRPRPHSVSAETKDWLAASPSWDAGKAKPYGMDSKFRSGDLVNHDTFGLGLVKKVMDTNRMYVLFEAGEKLMVCKS